MPEFKHPLLYTLHQETGSDLWNALCSLRSWALSHNFLSGCITCKSGKMCFQSFVQNSALICYCRYRKTFETWHSSKLISTSFKEGGFFVSNRCWPTRWWSFTCGCSFGRFFPGCTNVLRFLWWSQRGAEPGEEPRWWCSSSPAAGSQLASLSASSSVPVAQRGWLGSMAMHGGDR